MEYREFEIKGLFEITLKPYVDERGFFMRIYDNDEFMKHKLHREWVQENHSRSERRGIIRGLHFQAEPFAETKLIRCIRGEIFDVAVDLRKGSETFGKWQGIILSEENRKMFFIPRGFAHGFCTLSDISEVVYKVDNFYSPEHERGLLWNDRDISINWPLKNPILSAKDQNNLTLKRLFEHG
ncbi:MAG TPA: dTDP-4-dehydrorhamnose 3,5-epimerase [Bacteroidales bacterium]|nr:dTDP-4-dehydrorhamnose 3,5-epimerase [Bacteroidales bacterium]